MMWNGGYGMMGWGGGWLWPFHFLIPLLILGLIIATAVAVVRYAGGGWEDRPGRAGRGSPGLDALDERYARGEISRDEYLQKRRDILG